MNDDVTRALKAVSEGDPEATSQLIGLIYDELRVLAESKLVHERPDHTLQATALVHEAYVRLLAGGVPSYERRASFFAAASTAMRRILVDHARARNRVKRGGGRKRIPLEDGIGQAPDRDDEMLAVHELLDRLGEIYPRQARIVEMRFFGGLGVDDIADLLGVSPRTVKLDWRFARAWLFERMRSG